MRTRQNLLQRLQGGFVAANRPEPQRDWCDVEHLRPSRVIGSEDPKLKQLEDDLVHAISYHEDRSTNKGMPKRRQNVSVALGDYLRARDPETKAYLHMNGSNEDPFGLVQNWQTALVDVYRGCIIR